MLAAAKRQNLYSLKDADFPQSELRQDPEMAGRCGRRFFVYGSVLRGSMHLADFPSSATPRVWLICADENTDVISARVRVHGVSRRVADFTRDIPMTRSFSRDVAGHPHRGLTALMCWLLLICCQVVRPESAVAQNGDYASANTSSPRDTLRSFINACNNVHDIVDSAEYFDLAEPKHMAAVQRALDCIDDSELPAFTRAEHAGEIAACLKEILDRVELPPWDEIPDADEIAASSSDDKRTHYRIPETRISINRVEAGPHRYEFLFSPGTVERAFDDFSRIKSKPYRTDGPEVSPNFYRWYVSAPGHPAVAAIVKRMPESLRLGQTWGLANWKWIGLVLTLLVAIIAIWVSFRAYSRCADQARGKSLFRYWLTLVFLISCVLIPLAVSHVAYRYLTLRSTPLYVTNFVCTLVALLSGVVLISGVATRIATTVISSPNINPAGLHAQFIRITFRMGSIVAGIILLLVGGQYLGIPIATLLASAGIGGVALALGAQDTLKSLFGTFNLLGDKPFLVGDRIIFASYDGIVLDVGLRSSRIRQLNGVEVTIPNDQLAANDIENVTRRPYIRRVGTIRIPLDTPCDKVEQAATIIREELADHEGMQPDRPPRVYLDEFAADAFTIEFNYWYSPPDYWKYKAFGDRLNFAIFRRFEEHGIQFSLPFRHSFWKHDDAQGPLDVKLNSDGGTSL
jgi:MscS family membrane protein